jgi:hypothetical protein
MAQPYYIDRPKIGPGGNPTSSGGLQEAVPGWKGTARRPYLAWDQNPEGALDLWESRKAHWNAV